MNPTRPTLSKSSDKHRANPPARSLPSLFPAKTPPKPMSFRRWLAILILLAGLGWLSGWAVSSITQPPEVDLAQLGQPVPKIKPLPSIPVQGEIPPYISGNSPAPSTADKNPADETLAEKAFSGGANRQGEIVFSAGSLSELESLLNRAQAAGGTLLGVIRDSNSARISFPDATSMDNFLNGNPGDSPVPRAELNNIVSLPTPPAIPADPYAPGGLVAFGATALSYIGVPQDNSSWGRGVTIALLDTGLDPATLNLLRGGPITQYDLTSGQPITAAGHGDMVAALIAGAPGEQGIAPGAAILSIRVLDNNDQGDVFAVTDGIYTAVNDGAKIINLSLGTATSSTMLQTAIAYALNHDVVVVASAGNDGSNQITYPAAYPGVVSVGSIDATGQRASFSNYGSQMVITAPGVGITTITVNGTYSFSGTSASAPLVSGAIAGLLSTIPGISGQQAQNFITQYADFTGPYTNISTNPFYGNGVIDLTRVLNRTNPTYTDIALADLYLAITTMPTTPTAPMQVVVQNRGNSALNSIDLSVTIGTTTTDQYLSSMQAGEVRAVTVQLPVSDMLSANGLPVSATVSTGQMDVNTSNNTKARIIRLIPASASSASTGN